MSMPPAQPLYFGPADRTLFGWLHRPAERNARNTGIVLCSPSGYEAICTHRSYRIFAEAAAARGFPALRFDYDGTGDSSGHGLDADRVGHWLRSITIAIDTLKVQAQVDRVCVFGVRVGASLAAKAVQGRSDVHAMIAFAPVVKVKSYLREIRALSLAQVVAPPPADLKVDPELQEAAGFATTPETRAALTTIDLTTLDAAPAPHVLVLERDDLTPGDAWPRRLASLGAAVEQRQLEGYVDMMRDAHASKAPLRSIESALDWLIARDGVVAKPVAAATSPVVTAEFTEEGGRVRETAAFLDEQRILFGIVSEPIEPRAAVREVVVLLNSGTIHHVGPSRLYVAIARRCAARGMAALRIDLSGVGDSAVRRGEAENAPYSEGARIDVPAAVNFAQQRFPGAKVHLVGLCSGAYHALKAAAAGGAFRSIVVVNPLTFFWKPGMSLEYADFQVTSESIRYARSATTLASWLKLLRGNVDLRAAATVFWKRLNAIAKNSLRDLARRIGIEPRDDLATELLRIARQQTDMYFVFSASDPGHAMLCEQAGSIVPRLARREQLRISVVQGADHTFTAHWNRDQLITLLMAHLERHAASP
jgi:alpha-beta hydrolase superfamily lysophospholipase